MGIHICIASTQILRLHHLASILSIPFLGAQLTDIIHTMLNKEVTCHRLANERLESFLHVFEGGVFKQQTIVLIRT